MGPCTAGPIIANPEGSVPGVENDKSVSCKFTPIEE